MEAVVSIMLKYRSINCRILEELRNCIKGHVFITLGCLEQPHNNIKNHYVTLPIVT